MTPEPAPSSALAVSMGVQSSRLALPGRTLLVSLDNTDGQQRRARAAGEFVFEARPGQLAAAVPAAVSKRFASRPSLAQNKRDACLGAYHAHYLARKEIAKLDNACFVLEDDCKLLGNRDMPQATDLPTNFVLFLGCWITGRPVLRANDRSCFFGADGFLKQLTLMPLKSSIVPKRAAASRPASRKGGGELRVN